MEGVRRLPFELTLAAAAPEQIPAGVLVVGAFGDGTLPPSSQRVDRAAHGGLAAVLKLGDLDRTAGSTLLLPNLTGVAAERVLLVSLGPVDEYGPRSFNAALQAAARALAGGAAKDAAVTLTQLEVPGRSLQWRLQHASRLLASAAYRTVPSKLHHPPDGPRRGARRIVLLTEGTVGPAVERAVRRGYAIAEGMWLVRDLGSLPAGVSYPSLLADTARSLGREFGFEVEVLERDDMKELGMGAALAVGPTIGQSAKLILMHYPAGARGDRPIVLIGSGVACDSSGDSLTRTTAGEVRFGTSGAASILGAIKVAARLRLPINVIGIIASVEPGPGSRGVRRADVVTSMSGQTIEIRDEPDGRLAIADALTYAERFNPACVIDVAALTGGCASALGHVTSGLFANDDRLADDLLTSGTEAGDRAWRLPLWEEYEDQIGSAFADVSSAGHSSAAAITAACFLQRFAGPYPWAHLDISGTNALARETKAATGRPVPLLAEFLIRRATGAQASRSARAG